MAYDFSGVSDQQLDAALANAWALPEDARVAVSVERARRDEARRSRPTTAPQPDNVEANLEAAASPVTPDPSLKPKLPTYRQQLAQSPRNFSSEEADMIAAESSPVIQDILEDAPNRFERFGAQMNEMDARMRMERGQPAGTAPYAELTPPPSRPAPAKPAGPPVTMINGKPYVNIDGAIFPANSPMVNDPGEYVPTDYGYGTMMVDGIEVPIAEPGDTLLNQPAKYRLADVERERQRMNDHAVTVARRNNSIEENRRYGSPYLPAENWSEEQAGARVERKKGEVRRSNMGYAHAQRIRSLAEAMNVSEDVAAAAYEQAMSGVQTPTQTDVPAMGGQEAVAGPKARGVGYAPGALMDSQGLLTPAGVGHVMRTAQRALLADSANNGAVDVRRERKERARGSVSRSAMARGNPLEYLGRDDINDWQRSVVAEQFLRRPQEVTPLGVQAANNAQLTQLGLRVATGQGFQQLPPGAAELAQAKVDEAERAVPPAERARKYRDQKEIHPSELQAADEYVSTMYSTPKSVWGAGGLSSSFTTEEQQQTIDYLVGNGYDPVKAQRIVDQIVQKREGQSWWGNWE